MLVPSIVSIDLTGNSPPNVQPMVPNSEIHNELLQKLLAQVASQQGSRIVNFLDLGDITIDGGEI
jgi:hypothetical protein